MTMHKLARKALAIAAIVPATTLLLVACAGGGEPDDKPKSTTKPQTTSSTPSGAGPLPFPPGGPATSAPAPTSTAAGPTPTQAGPAPTTAPTTAAGSDVVKFGQTDLSHIDWKIACYEGESPSIYGSDANADPAATSSAPSLWVTTDSTGKVDFILVSSGSFTDPTLYYDASDGKGTVNFSLTGNDVVMNGQAFDFSDYSQTTPIDFEIRATCDSKY